MISDHTNIDHVEGAGVLNFLELDDIPVSHEGEEILPESIIFMDFKEGRPVFPDIDRSRDDIFLKCVQSSGKKWISLADRNGQPRFVIDSDHFIRMALFDRKPFVPFEHCHKPIVIDDSSMPLGQAILLFSVEPLCEGDDVIDYDILLVWNENTKRIITGADILGRLLRGISKNTSVS